MIRARPPFSTRFWPILLPLLAGFLLAGTGSAQDVRIPSAQKHAGDPHPQPHPLDFRRMIVDVAFEPSEGLVKGEVTHHFTPLRPGVDSIFLNGPGIRILEAKLDGRAVKHRERPGGVAIFPKDPLDWDESYELRLKYEATPRKGLYFVGWNDPRDLSRKQIWTQGQGIDNRHWIPMYDERNDKMITELIVTFDEAYEVRSNGAKKLERNNGDGTKTWHYAMTHSHPTYLIMLAIGKYAIDSSTTSTGTKLYHYYYPNQPEAVQPTYRQTDQMFELMERETGVPYPWASYSQIPVQDYMYGAMENTSATIFGDYLLTDKREALTREYLSVNIHELAHQWFGDLVTARSPWGGWLQEGFASYYPKRFILETQGQDAYEWVQYNQEVRSLRATERNPRPIVHPLSGRRIYYKGSFVVEMLRDVVGDKAFRRGIHHYLTEHQFANASTRDFYQAFQDTLGYTLEWFFTQWLEEPGEPHYRVSYANAEDDKGHSFTAVDVEQIQRQEHPAFPIFRMPVVIEVHYQNGASDRKEAMIDAPFQQVEIPQTSGKQIAYVLVDPGNRVLNRLSFERSPEELIAQARDAGHMIDRFKALKAMRELPLETKREFLNQRFPGAPFHAERAEIVRQLASDDNARSLETLAAAAKDPAVEVRRALVNNLPRVPEALRSQLVALLQDSSYQVMAQSLRLLQDAFPDNTKRYLKAVEGVDGEHKNIAILRLELQARRSRRPKRELDQLARYASRSYEFLTRRNAMKALKRLNHLDEAYATSLLRAATHYNTRLAEPAQEIIAYYRQQSAQEELLKRAYQNGDWAEHQTQILQPLLEL